MSASAILSLITAAATSSGNGAAPVGVGPDSTATPAAGGDFESILATQTTMTVAAPAAIKGLSAELDPPLDDASDPGSLTVQPSDVAAPQPWFQMVPVGFSSVVPTAPQTRPGEGVAGSAILFTDTPGEPVTPEVSGKAIPTLALETQPLASTSEGLAASNGTPGASGKTNPAVEASTTKPESSGGEVSPAEAAGTISEFKADIGAPSSKPAAARDASLIAPTVTEARPAQNSRLTDAALTSLRQMPGAAALQQITVSRPRGSSPAATPSQTVSASIATATDGLDTTARIGSAALAAAVPIIDGQVPPAPPVSYPALAGAALSPLAAGAVRVAPSARTASLGETAFVTASDAPTPAGDAKAAAFASIAFDDAMTAKPVGLPPQDFGSIAEVPLDPAMRDTARPPQTNTVPPTSPTLVTAQGGPLLSGLSRATIETTTNLAAQITSRLSGKSTRFELGLTPEGLGRVDVTLDIDADGQLSARLAFDNPLAATELRGRADELRRQLEDAGFTVAGDALDFSSRDNPSGGERRQQRATAYADRHAASNDLSDQPPVWTVSSSRLTPQGVDVKV